MEVLTEVALSSCLTVRELVRLGKITSSTAGGAVWIDHRSPGFRLGYLDAVESLVRDIHGTLLDYGLHPGQIAEVFVEQYRDFKGCGSTQKMPAVTMGSADTARVIFKDTMTAASHRAKDGTKGQAPPQHEFMAPGHNMAPLAANAKAWPGLND